MRLCRQKTLQRVMTKLLLAAASPKHYPLRLVAVVLPLLPVLAKVLHFLRLLLGVLWKVSKVTMALAKVLRLLLR